MKCLSFVLPALLLCSFAESAPTRVPSFGPNGTHWPENVPTPFPGDFASIPNVIDVDCSWSAISTAIKGLTADKVAAGVLIRVKAGALPGNGQGATDKPVLDSLGSLDWTKRVTICPKDGYGTVTCDYIRFNKIYNICIAGFEIRGNNFTACTNSALAWSYISGGFAAFYSDNNLETTGFEIVEVVFGIDAVTATSDRCDFYVGGTGGTLRDFRIDGCYFAPKYRKAGVTPAPHVDTIQWGLGDGGTGYPTGFYFRDTAVFGSQTTAFQRVDYATFEHVFAVAGGPARNRYPYTDGSDSSGGNYIFNGSGYYNTAKDCVFVGQQKFTNSDAPHWQKVTSTKVSSSFKGTNPVEGSWTLDNTLSTILEPSLPPIPTLAYRATVWNWGVTASTLSVSVSVDVK